MTRTLYVRDAAIWKAAAEMAETLGISLGQYVERCLAAYITQAPACGRCDAIKRMLDEPVKYGE